MSQSNTYCYNVYCSDKKYAFTITNDVINGEQKTAFKNDGTPIILSIEDKGKKCEFLYSGRAIANEDLMFVCLYNGNFGEFVQLSYINEFTNYKLYNKYEHTNVLNFHIRRFVEKKPEPLKSLNPTGWFHSNDHESFAINVEIAKTLYPVIAHSMENEPEKTEFDIPYNTYTTCVYAALTFVPTCSDPIKSSKLTALYFNDKKQFANNLGNILQCGDYLGYQMQKFDEEQIMRIFNTDKNVDKFDVLCKSKFVAREVAKMLK